MKRPDPCPSDATMDRCFSEGADPSFLAHLSNCARCGSEWEAMSQLRRRARELPQHQPRDLAAARARLLHAARTQGRPARSKRWLLVASAAVILVAVGLSVAWSTPEPSNHGIVRAPTPAPTSQPNYRASIEGDERARFVRISAQPDEVVRLYEGTITLDVEHLAAGERFRVLTEDAEVEVHGTVFTVEAHADAIDAVHVTEGRVEVRRQTEVPVFLGAGERWRRPEPPVVTVSRAETPRRASPREDAREESAAQLPWVHDHDSAETAFQEGWSALRRGDPTEAARRFETISNHELAEEAAYWRAVALKRSGQRDDAITAFESFLREHPESRRRGEAAVALGLLERERGDEASAQRHLRSALEDPDSRVRLEAERSLR